MRALNPTEANSSSMSELLAYSRLYHGSNQTVSEPDPFHGSNNKDFGQGFYTIPSAQDAAAWAVKIAKRRGGSPTVSAYDFTSNERLSAHVFHKSEEALIAWIDFILYNRKLERLIGYPYQNPFVRDIIVGPIADFAVARSFELFTLSQEEYFESLEFGKNPNKFKLRLIEDLDINRLENQVCFKNLASIRCLSFDGVKKC
jgi:hypothetical protein